jgi:hypothetical protein
VIAINEINLLDQKKKHEEKEEKGEKDLTALEPFFATRWPI